MDLHQFRKEFFEFGHWGYLGFKMGGRRPVERLKLTKNIRNHTDFVRFHAQLFRMLASPMSTKLFSPNIRPLFWLRKKRCKTVSPSSGSSPSLNLFTKRKQARDGCKYTRFTPPKTNTSPKKGPFQYESTLPTTSTTFNYYVSGGNVLVFQGSTGKKTTARRHLDSLEEPLLNGMLNF